MLPYDVVTQILEFAADDYGLLFQCSLVTWEFNCAASQLLYFHVVVSPPFCRVLNLRDTGSIPERSNFTSAQIKRNAIHVRVLEISGFISPRPPPRNAISEKIASAIKLFVHLRAVRLTPVTQPEDLVSSILPVLCDLRTLDEVIVNNSCANEERSSKLVQLGNLRKLDLISPGRAILQLLPDWLSRISKTLVELHLMSNCGSVTPGVLKQIIPYIEHTVQSITLGLSYSLTNDDVFSFLFHLPNLQRLHLYHYWQLKQPTHQPKLVALRSFTVTYKQIYTRKDTDELDKWIRRAIAGSSHLEQLHLVCDQEDSSQTNSTPAVAHDALVEHIVGKHAGNIRVLALRPAFIRAGGLRALLASCNKLEECHFRTTEAAMSTIAASKDTLPLLHTASLQISNVKRGYQVEESSVSVLFRHGPPLLRRLQIDEHSWEAEWRTNSSQNVEFVVQRISNRTPPWSCD